MVVYEKRIMTKFQNLHQPTGRIINIDEKDYIFFGGTAYLGLLDNPDYIELFKKGIDVYGLNNGTSRSNNVQLGIYNEAEDFLAKNFGFESSAIFSGGYLAVQATVRTFVQDKVVFYAPDAHPSLWLSAENKVVGDFDSWLIGVVDEINSSKEKEFVVVSNTLDNLKPEFYDFTPLLSIDSKKSITLIIDDSHGIGVINENAISVALEAFKILPNFNIIVVASLAKGMGTDAGVVLSSFANISILKRSPMFMGASPCSPAALFALINSEKIRSDAYDKLQRNIAYFRQRIQELECIKFIDNFPVFTSSESEMYSYLLENKVLISSFPYPLSTSPLLNRVVVSSLHTEDDLDLLSESLVNRFS